MDYRWGIDIFLWSGFSGASVGTSGHTEPQQLCVARSRDQLKISRISATVFPEVSSRQLARRQARPRDTFNGTLSTATGRGLILETRDVTAGAGATAVATPRRRKLSAGPRVGPQAAGAPRHSARCLGGPWSEEVLLSGAQSAGAGQKHHSFKCRMNVCRQNGKSQ